MCVFCAGGEVWEIEQVCRYVLSILVFALHVFCFVRLCRHAEIVQRIFLSLAFSSDVFAMGIMLWVSWLLETLAGISVVGTIVDQYCVSIWAHLASINSE